MNCQPFPLGKLCHKSQDDRDLLGILNGAGAVVLVPGFKRVIRDESMPIPAQRPPVLSSHLAGDPHDPGPEPIGVPQPRQVSIRPQETLLRQVARARRASRDPVNDGPHEPRVPVVEKAERLALASPNSRHQVCISRFVVPRHHRTSGRAPRYVQEKQNFLWSGKVGATRRQRLHSTRGWECIPELSIFRGGVSLQGPQ